ncbi:hypothetical protein FQN49_008621, partial [Arthroderma sp. PD_2]
LIRNLPKHDLPPFTSPLKNTSQKPTIRSVWVYLPPEPLDPGKNEFSMPETWTVKTFADYIEDLVRTPVSRLVHGRLKNALQISHKDVVGDMIRRLLLDPENRKYFSSRSISLSVSFFTRDHCRSSLQSLLPAFEGLLTSRTANAVIRAAIFRRDFVVLRWCLSAMKREGVSPGSWAWVSVLSAITPHSLRFDVLVRAKESGVFGDRHVFQIAVSTAIQPAFGRWLKNGGSVASFMKTMDQKLGSDWLSVASINRLLLEGSLRSEPGVISDILLFCQQNAFKLETTSLNNALFYFLHQPDTASKSFIDFYLKFAETFRVKGDDRTMDILWHLAWGARAYNICRVLWRYACLDGWVKQKMQASIYASLHREMKGTSALPEREIWMQNVGKVAAGVIPFNSWNTGDRENLTKLVHGDHISYSGDDITEPLLRRKALAKELVESDMTARDRGYVYTEPLVDVLARAYILDEEWGFCHEKPVDWLWKNSVKFYSIKSTPSSQHKSRESSLKPSVKPPVTPKRLSANG